jgi:hypothetical protein
MMVGLTTISTTLATQVPLFCAQPEPQAVEPTAHCWVQIVAEQV